MAGKARCVERPCPRCRTGTLKLQSIGTFYFGRCQDKKCGRTYGLDARAVGAGAVAKPKRSLKAA